LFDNKTHIGVIVEESPDIITTEDKRFISLLDICGLLLDANKKLIRRLEVLESKKCN